MISFLSFNSLNSFQGTNEIEEPSKRFPVFQIKEHLLFCFVLDIQSIKLSISNKLIYLVNFSLKNNFLQNYYTHYSLGLFLTHFMFHNVRCGGGVWRVEGILGDL